jgi:hypothetical protein
MRGDIEVQARGNCRRVAVDSALRFDSILVECVTTFNLNWRFINVTHGMIERLIRSSMPSRPKVGRMAKQGGIMTSSRRSVVAVAALLAAGFISLAWPIQAWSAAGHGGGHRVIAAHGRGHHMAGHHFAAHSGNHHDQNSNNAGNQNSGGAGNQNGGSSGNQMASAGGSSGSDCSDQATATEAACTEQGARSDVQEIDVEVKLQH